MDEIMTEQAQENFILASLRVEASRRADKSKRYVTESELARACDTVLRKARVRAALVRNGGAPESSISRQIRGMLALKGGAINPETAERDVRYVRALTTGGTPGSYLTPTIQANDVVEQLAQYNSARAAGCRIWPAAKVEEFRVPLAIAAPTFAWALQNSQITVSDPDAGQLTFTMKTCAALIRASVQLFRASVPSFDLLLENSFAAGIGEAEDVALHATSTVSNGPLALMSAAGITTLNAAGNGASGGNLLLGDVTSLIEKAITGKSKPPYCWFGAGRTWLRLLNLISTTSQPLIIPDESINPLSFGSVYGFPFFSASIPTNEAVGSGSNQSHLVLAPPRAIHVAESGAVEMSIATQSAPEFESNQVAVRITRETAFAYGPQASICVLKGVS